MKYLIQKRKELNIHIDFALLLLIIGTMIIIYLINNLEPEIIFLEEEFYDEPEIIVEEIIEDPNNLTTEQYINRLISTINRKCSNSVTTNSRIIYYIKWDNINELWGHNSNEVKNELNHISSVIEGIWKSKGYNYIIEVVLDNPDYDRVIAVSTNGRITFSSY